MITIYCCRLPAQIVSFILLFCLLFPVFSCWAEDSSQYQYNLQENADRLGLWQSRRWHALLHMPLDNPGESRIVSPEFFLSTDGSLNPAAEGAATLSSFFHPLQSGQEDSHPQCLYPARYHWLKEQLFFDSDFLFEQSCPQLTEWMEAMEPDGLTLVFPEAYLNNPASMFGHTLLRIEQKNARSPLLAPSITFAAITDEKPSVGYAVKGIFGGYSGAFSDGLYVDQVRTYGALENRDIYEYRLGLSDSETRFLLEHVWELKRASFDYFFIDENCSYQLLALLEVARPSLNLTGKVQYVALPVETIRLVTTVPGLLQGVTYRPSRRTALQQRTRNFSWDRKKTVETLAEKGRLPNAMQWNTLNKFEQAEILEAAIELFLYNQAVTTGKNDANAPVLQHLLTVRNQLNVAVQAKTTASPSVRPDQGHGTTRAGFGMGVDATDFFVEVEFRPVLHDLMDPGPGYVDGAQVEFFSTALRYYPEQEQLKLQTVDLLNIVSVAPRDGLVQPISWIARIGMDQMRYSGGGDHLTGKAMAGLGASTWLVDELQGYCLLAGDLLVSDQFEYGWNAGLGPIVGVRSGFDRWNFILQAQAGYFFFNQADWNWSLQFVQALHITPDFSMRLEITREQEFAEPITETVFSLFWYY